MKIATLISYLLFPSRLIFPSRYHKNIRIGYSYGHMTLYTGDISQSGGEYVSMWKKAVNYADKKNHKVMNCLMLGVGGGTAAGVVKSKYPACKITGIEIDPQMVKAAKEFFGINKFDGFQLIIDDACRWIHKNLEKYDLIVIDLFINDLNPSCSRTKKFLTTVKKILKQNGSILYNSHYRKENPEEYEKLKFLCSKIFKKVDEIHRFPKNRVLLLA